MRPTERIVITLPVSYIELLDSLPVSRSATIINALTVALIPVMKQVSKQRALDMRAEAKATKRAAFEARVAERAAAKAIAAEKKVAERIVKPRVSGEARDRPWTETQMVSNAVQKMNAMFSDM